MIIAKEGTSLLYIIYQFSIKNSVVPWINENKSEIVEIKSIAISNRGHNMS